MMMTHAPRLVIALALGPLLTLMACGAGDDAIFALVVLEQNDDLVIDGNDAILVFLDRVDGDEAIDVRADNSGAAAFSVEPRAGGCPLGVYLGVPRATCAPGGATIRLPISGPDVALHIEGDGIVGTITVDDISQERALAPVVLDSDISARSATVAWPNQTDIVDDTISLIYDGDIDPNTPFVVEAPATLDNGVLAIDLAQVPSGPYTARITGQRRVTCEGFEACDVGFAPLRTELSLTVR